MPPIVRSCLGVPHRSTGLTPASRLLPWLMNLRDFPGVTYPARKWASARLVLEQLEDYTLPSASIGGGIWNDLNGDAIRQPDEVGLSARIAYLDLNHNGVFDTVTTTRAAPSTAIAVAPGALGSFGGFMSALQAQNLPGKLVNLAVTMDLTNTGTDDVVVAVISPTGLTVPNLPNLFTIRPGEHFVGTFDGKSTTAVATAPRPLPPGTYAPEQSFATPLSYINGTDPNGTWGLVFFGDTSALDLKSWSLAFTTTEPSASTDAQGLYSFEGLAAGTYDVRVALAGADRQTFPGGGAARTVVTADGRVATAVDFGVRAAPDLTPIAFRVTTPATAWGQDVTVEYSVANLGDAPADPFDVEVRLSADGRTGAGTLLGTVRVAGLAARATTSGSVTVRLPDAPPAGFGNAGRAYVGVRVDPSGAVAEVDETNNGNQGAGIDLARVDGSTGAAANVPVVSADFTQQAPTLAVDPANPLHLVAAYLDAPANGAYTGLSVSRSADGGATWSARTRIALPAGYDQGAAAPTVVFDAAGRVHISFMAVRFLGSQPALVNPDSNERAFGFTANNGVFVVSSADGGATWGPAAAVASHLYDPATGPVVFETFPSLAADTSRFLADGVTPNPNFGSLYAAWSRFYPAGQFPGQPASTSGSDVMLAVSRDGGLTWTTQLRTTGAYAGRSVILDPRYRDNGTGLPGRGFVTFPTVTVGAGGGVYVSTYAGGEFAVYYSATGGRSFTAPDYAGQTGLPFPTLNGVIIPSPALQTNAYLGLPGARTLPLRQIVADPANPGRVYAVAVNSVTARVGAQAGQVIDPGDVVFARSDDFGQTWTSNFTILKQPPVVDRLTPAQIASYVPALNDDNAGDQAGIVEDISTQVLAGQALPSLAVDGNGNVVVVWYDTRAGAFHPNNPNTPITNALSVWGAVSTDGGRTFSPNFQVSDTTFDTINGRYRAGNGATSTYLGDQIAVTIAGGTAYVAWSDARGPFSALRQDVYFGSFPLAPSPAAPADRFAGNDTIDTATDLTAGGFYSVTAPLDLARLVLTPGRADRWFALSAGANGPLIVTATGGRPGDLQLEVTDETGAALPANIVDALDATGAVVGKRVTVAATFGSVYFVHVSGANDNALPFALSLSNLTADLGPQVAGTVAGTLDFGQDVYRVSAGVGGTLKLDLKTADPNAFQFLIVLTPDGVSALNNPNAGDRTVTLPAAEGQTFLILVIGDPSAYTLSYTNADPYAAGGATVYLPTGGTPASVAVADFDGDGHPDLLATTTDRADVVSVFLGNGDGTFQAPRQFDAGAGLRGTLTADNRQPVVFDVNKDGIPDAVVPNFRSADVSVLLGRGDGTFQPQRRFDATTSPDFTATGDFDRDGNPDLVVLQNFPQLGSASVFSVLLGSGDGRFAPAVEYDTAFTNGAGPVLVGDFTGDGTLDLLVFSKNTPLGELYRGNGDGTFTELGTFRTPENAFTVQAVDLDGNGILDLVFGGTNSGSVYVTLGNGDGTFQPATRSTALIAGPGDNVGVRSVTLIAFDPANSPLPLTAPPVVNGVQTDYGSLALVATAGSRTGQGGGRVVLLPELVDAQGRFVQFSAVPVTVATVKETGNLAVGDFDGDGKTDVAVVDAGGLTVVYGISAAPPVVPANTTAATARDLATVVHYVTPALSIVPGRADAYYTFTVPTEVAGGGPQVIDLSAAFRYETGPSLQMQVLDAGGNVLASGARVRVVAAQGAQLTVRVFGQTAGAETGYGAYTLDITVLPQVVAAEAKAFLPGGPATSIVLTLQGDRLDPATAEDPANYLVMLQLPGGSQVIPVKAVGGGQPVVYNPGATVGVSSGVTYPPAVRQTVTLLFDAPLPVGSYSITLKPGIQAAPFAAGEVEALAGGAAFAGHPVVSVAGGVVRNGSTLEVPDLVAAGAGPATLAEFDTGTRFLTQLHNDLGALLDALLRAKGDDPSISPALMAQILARILPGLDPTASLLVIWLDPVSINLADSEGARAVYTEGGRAVESGLRNTYVEVGGNMELVVVAAASGTFTLNVATAGAASRGGAAVITNGGVQPVALTDAIRGGTDRFEFTISRPAGAETPVGVAPPPPAGTGAGSGPTGGPGVAIGGTRPEPGNVGGGNGSVATVAQTAVNLLLVIPAAGGELTALSISGGGGTRGEAAAATASATTGGVMTAGVLAAFVSSDLSGPLHQVIGRLVGRWGGEARRVTTSILNNLGEAVLSTLRRFLPAVPKERADVPDAGPDPAAVLPVEPPADGAAPAPVEPPVSVEPPTPTPEPAADPELGLPIDDRAAVACGSVPAVAAEEPQHGGVAGVALAALGSLLGVFLVDRVAPAGRGRRPEDWPDALPHGERS